MRSMFIALLATAPAALALEARQATLTTTTSGAAPSSTGAFADCSDAFVSWLDAITAVPTPTGAAANSYASSASATDDPCSLLSAAPSSIQPELASYISQVGSAVTAKPELVTKMSSCAADPDFKTFIDPIFRFTACNAAPTGSQTKNAGPRETGAVAMGAAVVALVGAVGLL